MLIFEGGSAVSRFRINKLCNQVRDSLTGLGELSARYLHVASTDRALSSKKRETLSRLLDYGAPAKVRSIGREILVFPRLGTTSPWSTKATDIAHHCGLTEIVRLERGVAWSVPSTLDSSAVEQHLVPLLYDRMTESILSDRESLQLLFAQSEARRLAKIDVLRAGRDALVEANEQSCLELLVPIGTKGYDPWHRQGC